MNEVSSIRGVNQVPVAPASSTAATVNKAAPGNSEHSGNSLPLSTNSAVASGLSKEPQSVNTEKVNQQAEQVNIDDAVASMNEFVQTVQRDLQFTVDEELDRTVVKVLDSESGEVIRQIPEQTFLELARNMKEYGEIRFIDDVS